MSLEERLRALAEADAKLAAPPRVEAALSAAFRMRHARPLRLRWWSVAVAAAVAALLLVAVRISTVRPGPVDGPDEILEVATGFFPLMPGFDAEAAQSEPTVRVEMPRSVLASFGLPVDVNRVYEPVKADLVIGNDGMTRAIRFVSTQAD
jgi:hypothetical protein